MSFCKNFAWGVATASYQIEGGTYEDDKGLSVWDVASETEGRVFEGHKGHIGCDHYHRWKEDVALMKQLGIKAYRFSLNWSRLIPEGEGKVSEAGKNFYLNLFKELKSAGIEPWVTLFHWDYPYALYKRGGWLNPASSDWFAAYAKTVAELFGDYLEHIILINEPECFVGLGHFTAGHAPFLKLPVRDVAQVSHNVLLACGKAEKILRKTISHPVKIGTAQAYWPAIPATHAEKDVAMAKKETFTCHHDFGGITLWLDPLLKGEYPADFLAWFKENGFVPPKEDMEIIKSKFDFCGLNTYSGNPVRDEGGKPVYVTPSPSVPKTDMRWNVFPEVMYYGPKFVHERYGLPVVYTEDGVALAEWKDLNGEINDDSRIDFLKRYLRELHRAAQEIPVEGYFYWTLYDNYEWTEGFSKKFGIVHFDPETLERTPKKSAWFYRKVIETNGDEALK